MSLLRTGDRVAVCAPAPEGGAYRGLVLGVLGPDEVMVELDGVDTHLPFHPNDLRLINHETARPIEAGDIIEAAMALVNSASTDGCSEDLAVVNLRALEDLDRMIQRWAN